MTLVCSCSVVRLAAKGALYLGLLLGLAHGLEAAPAKIADIRAMRAPSKAEAAGPDTTVHGILIWVNGSKPTAAFGVADETGGIYVKMATTALLTEMKDLVMGSEVEVEGVVNWTGYAPFLEATSVKLLGEQALPEPPLLSAERLQSGAYDAQWVAVEGVVISVCNDAAQAKRRLVNCSGLDGHFVVRVDATEWNRGEQLVDASVHVRGFAITLCNTRREPTGVVVAVGRQKDFIVKRPPPTDPFSGPRRAITTGILPFSVRGRSLHRSVVAGTVTYVSGSELFLQDAITAVHIERWSGDPVRVGDRVDAAAFIDQANPVARLHDAVVRKVSSTVAIEPAATTVDFILRHDRDHSWRGWEPLPVDYDGRLVKVGGKVIGSTEHQMRSDAIAQLILLVQADGGHKIECAFPPGMILPARVREVGSELELTGIVRVRYSSRDSMPEFAQPQGINMLIRGQEDVVVVKAAAYWTQRRLAIVAVASGLLALLLTVWTWWLRRHLRRQSNELAQHRVLEAEHLATMEERTRLSDDLHDGVQQIIAGASMQLERARHAMQGEAGQATHALDTARLLMLRARDEIRRSVWALRECEDSDGSLCLGLKKLVGTQRLCADAKIAVTSEGPALIPLPLKVINAFVLTAQEAITNAVKHGRAKRIDVHVRYAPREVTMTVTDDGEGFDPAQQSGAAHGHLGLVSMRNRITRIGGKLEIGSQPGVGTSVAASLPMGLGEPTYSTEELRTLAIDNKSVRVHVPS